MAKKSTKKPGREAQQTTTASAARGSGKARRKAEKRAAELEAELEKVRKKAVARIEKAQQAIRKAEKRADKARAAADSAAGMPARSGTEPATIPTSPTPVDVPAGVPAPGPDYAVPVAEHGSAGSEFALPDVSVPEAVTPDYGTSPGGEASDSAGTGSAVASADREAATEGSLTPPLPSGGADSEPNAGWTLVRLRTVARERGVPGASSKSKAELLEALKG